MKVCVNEILNVDALTGIKGLPNSSVDCCVTSPPYWALRDYGVKGQIGQETTPKEYVNKLRQIFEEVRRVLKPEGTLWLNLGDSYASNGKNRTWEQAMAKSTTNGVASGQAQILKQQNKVVGNLKPKDLVGIPWMVAFALRDAGWYLRQDIIWSKPNPMPESVKDRCTRSHEYIFMFSKSRKYYYDAEAIKTGLKESSVQRLSQDIENQKGSNRANGGSKTNGANKRSVWNVSTKPFKEAHFATFPENLIVDCIKAGCPEDGIVLDPFMGAGTTALVACKLNRNYVGFEINPIYIRIAEKRLKDELGLFKDQLI